MALPVVVGTRTVDDHNKREQGAVPIEQEEDRGPWELLLPNALDLIQQYKFLGQRLKRTMRPLRPMWALDTFSR